MHTYANIFIKDSMFTVPDDQKTPIIMVGPGTGVCPFIGIIEERRQLQTAASQQLSKTLLFFGCRNQNSDYIFRDTLEKAKTDEIVELSVAYSRPEGGPDAAKGYYVQDIM